MMKVSWQGRDYVLGADFPSSSKEDISPDFWHREHPHDPPVNGPQVHKEDEYINEPHDAPFVTKQEWIAQTESEPIPCVPVEVDFVVADPFNNPFNIGDATVFSVNAITGNGPYTYQWYLNGVATVTTATYPYTVSDGDIVNKDVTGLGVIGIYVTVTGECGSASTDVNGTFAAQGTPP